MTGPDPKLIHFNDGQEHSARAGLWLAGVGNAKRDRAWRGLLRKQVAANQVGADAGALVVEQKPIALASWSRLNGFIRTALAPREAAAAPTEWAA
jgi:hypothetical protein